MPHFFCIRLPNREQVRGPGPPVLELPASAFNQGRSLLSLAGMRRNTDMQTLLRYCPSYFKHYEVLDVANDELHRMGP